MDQDRFYDNFEEQFKQYAAHNHEIRAVLVMGSRARRDHPADQWSDLDVFVYCHHPNKYLMDAGWLADFGKVITTVVSNTAAGDVERLTLFDGGYQVDVVYFDLDALNLLAEAKSISGALGRGIYVLVDKDDKLSGIEDREFIINTENTISEQGFVSAVNRFGFATLYTVKQVMRGNLWVAKTWEQDIRHLLLTMIEWHEKMRHGGAYDTWYGGKFIADWASPEIMESIKTIFTGYSKKESIDGLWAGMKLFQTLALELKEQYHYEYPYELMEFVMLWIEKQRDQVSFDSHI